MNEQQLRQSVVDTMKGWRGVKKGSDAHHAIVDTYNTIKPLPRGHRLTYTDNWCAGTVSAAFQINGLTDIMVPECSCTSMMEGAEKRGLWVGKKDYVPTPGDICLYTWASGNHHVGLVTAVNGSTITVTEGNKTVGGVSMVADRPVPVGWSYIWGYIVPDYKSEAKEEEHEMSREEIEALVEETVQRAVDKLVGKVYTSREEAPSWAQPAIQWAQEQKILGGDEHGRLHLTLDNLVNLQMLYQMKVVSRMDTGKEAE